MPLLIVAEQGRTWGWDSGRALLCYAIGVVGLIAFILAERAYQDDALLPLRLFRNRSFAVGSVGSIVLGAGMFGGILLLPQYLQIVHGSSPTVAGLQMIPLVAGIMTGAMGSGIAISKTGKYKIFPLVGIVFIVVALVAMSFIVDADTSVWTLVPFMVLMGLGLGFNFQPVILAVQNAVSPREMGVATSSVTFFRQMGGTIGVAAFLSILFTRLPDRHRQRARTPPRPPTPASARRCRAASCRVAATCRDTSFIQQLPDYLALPFKAGFSDSIDLVFLVAAGRRGDRLLRAAVPPAGRPERQVGHPGPAGRRPAREPRSRRTSRPTSRPSRSVRRHPRRPPRRRARRRIRAADLATRCTRTEHAEGCFSHREGQPSVAFSRPRGA